MPNNPIVDGFLKKTSKDYIDPIFSQRWGFFSPRPGIEDIDFEYICHKDFTETEWINLEKERLEEHQKNKFKGLARVLYLSKGLAEELLRRYELNLKSCMKDNPDRQQCTKVTKLEIFSTKEFFFANKLFRKKCRYSEFEGYEFRIRLTKPVQFSQKDRLIKREYAYLRFPKIPYQK